MSFLDMCKKCEKLWARLGNEKLIIYVASLSKYTDKDDGNRNKRIINRNNGNKNLILLFLNFCKYFSF